MHKEATNATDAEYRKDYNRGWRSSAGPNHTDALERADMREESAAWYDGYMDFACGWDKWTTPNNDKTEGTK